MLRLVVFLFDDLLLSFDDATTDLWATSISMTNLENPSSMSISISGEERERKQFVVAVEDGYGYVLYQ